MKRYTIVLTISLFFSVVFCTSVAHAGTLTLVPNGDVTTQWNTGGANDGSCVSSTTHCSLVDESSASPNTADYVTTGTTSGNNRVEQYNMTTGNVGQGATSIKVRAYSRIFAGFGSDDRVFLDANVGGTNVGGSGNGFTLTTTFAWKEVTFNGNWTQANIDGIIFWMANSVSSLQEDVRTGTVEMVITYTDPPTLNQSTYRVYQNADSTAPGTPLAASNTAADLPSAGAAFRIRTGIEVTGTAWSANYGAYKLQYAEKTAGSCSAQTGYGDVAAGSGAIRWNDNATPSDGATISSNANDPTTSGSKTYETYEEANNFANPSAVAIGNTGLWDFSLKDFSNSPGTSYCFRLVKSDGSTIDTYTNYPEVRVVGNLAVDVVDNSGASVGSPSVVFSNTVGQVTCQQTAGTLGTTSQKVRINNDLVTTGWVASIAATSGQSALWSAGTPKYDFNDSSGSPPGCSAGLDSDVYAGQLKVRPSLGTSTPKGGCSGTGVSLGSDTSFVEGTTNAITLISGSSSSQRFCYFDLTGVGLEQQVPASQALGTYTLDLTMTVVAQ